jgi:hypothetical protein
LCGGGVFLKRVAEKTSRKINDLSKSLAAGTPFILKFEGGYVKHWEVVIIYSHTTIYKCDVYKRRNGIGAN